jgi:hypothetical protein
MAMKKDPLVPRESQTGGMASEAIFPAVTAGYNTFQSSNNPKLNQTEQQTSRLDVVDGQAPTSSTKTFLIVLALWVRIPKF